MRNMSLCEFEIEGDDIEKQYVTMDEELLIYLNFQ